MVRPVVLSLPEYAQEVAPPQVFVMPAINPFSVENADMGEAEVSERLNHYGIPVDLPIVAQISRFDRWKEPEGVIEAFQIARRQVAATLVLLGNAATDDPEGQEVFESLLKHKEQRIIILTAEDSALVNALQRRAKSLARARDSVRKRFLMTRKIEQYLDLFAAFEPRCTPDPRRLAALGAGAAGRPR